MLFLKTNFVNVFAHMFVNVKRYLIGVIFVGINLSGINLGEINLRAIAQTNPAFANQNILGRWQVKFPTTDLNPDVEVAITSDGRIFYVDKVKGEAIEIMQLLEKISNEAKIPDSIKIIDIQAQAKAEAIARQNQRLQAEVQTVLSTIHQAQLEYFAKNKEFATKLEDLGFGSEISSEVFIYKIEAIEPKFIVQALAITKNEVKDRDLTFIGISYITQEQGKSAIALLICQGTKKANQIEKLTPRFIKIDNFIQEIKCPVGFE
jgi:hypothetical protein